MTNSVRQCRTCDRALCWRGKDADRKAVCDNPRAKQHGKEVKPHDGCPKWERSF